jgi:hypothetical protein
MTYAQAIHQNLLDKLFTCQLAQTAIELQTNDPFRTVFSQTFDLFPKTGQARWCLVASKKLPWLGFENHNRCRLTQVCGFFPDLLQDFLVA